MNNSGKMSGKIPGGSDSFRIVDSYNEKKKEDKARHLELKSFIS